MYPIQCPGGYPVPAKQGKFEVCGFCITIADVTASAQFAIVDDPGIDKGNSNETGRLLTTLTDQKGVLANLRGVANTDGTLNYEFSEPIKTRYGISIYGNNFVAGSVCVYRR